MNLSKLFSFFIFLSTLIFAIIFSIQAFSLEKNIGQMYTAMSSQVPTDVLTRKEVINIIKRAIELNKDFKSTINKDDGKYRKKRAEVEKYYEEILSPTLADVARLLSTDRDIDLAVEFFNLLISYENSADELLSYTLGEIFFKNPDFVNEVFCKLDKAKQEFIYRQLEWGFENVIYSMDKSDQRIGDSYKGLQLLKDNIGKVK